MKPEWLTKEWLCAFGPTHTLMKTKGNYLVFVGKRGTMLLCRISYLAKRDGISVKAYLIKAILKGCKGL